MSKFNKALFTALAFALTACGAGSGTKRDDPGHTPLPPKEEPAPAQPETHGTELPLAFSADQGISSANGAFIVRYEWVTGPSVDGANELTLTFGDSERRVPATVNDVVVQPWMTGMGHGNGNKHQVVRDATSPNIFHVTKVFVTMSGLWDFRVRATVNGVADQAVQSLDIK